MTKKTNGTFVPRDPSNGLIDKRIPLVDIAKVMSSKLGIKIPKTDPIKNPVEKILKFAWVPCYKLYINYDRQRWPEPKQIYKLNIKWNIICVTPAQARYSKKQDRYYISDGQQHILAWIMKYGLDCVVPVFYIESEDENDESTQLLALNCDNEPMAKYFIHKQNIMMKQEPAMNIESTVLAANCETAYKKTSAGCITHISDLYKAYNEYGSTELKLVLSKLRSFYPEERIETPTMLGYLKVRELMRESGDIPTDQFESIFNDMFYYPQQWFTNSKKLHAYIHRQFVINHSTNYKGMGHREQVASGIIDIYEQNTGNKILTKPFPISIPLIEDKEIVETELEEDSETVHEV